MSATYTNGQKGPADIYKDHKSEELPKSTYIMSNLVTRYMFFFLADE